MVIKKVLAPAIIERTNHTYPDYKDALILLSHFNTMNISLSTYKLYGPVNPYPAQTNDPINSMSMEITYDEAIILRNKLNEFISSYNEYAKYNFMAGEHESLVLDCSKFTDVQDVELGCKEPYKPISFDFLRDYDVPLPDKK